MFFYAFTLALCVKWYIKRAWKIVDHTVYSVIVN